MTDRRRQPAPADRATSTGRDGRGLIRRIGSVDAAGRATGDDGEHAEAGPVPTTSRWAAPLRVRASRTGAVAGASWSPGHDDPPPHAGRVPKLEASMPTEAKQEKVAELRAQLAGSRTLIVSEY